MPLNLHISPIEGEYHGVIIRDPYRWLEDRCLPDTEAWIHEQQGRCKAYFDSYPSFERLRRKVNSYLNVEVVDQPTRVGDCYFYRKREKGQEQGSIYLRSVQTGLERLLVNPAKDGPFTSIGIHCIAENGELLAFDVRQGGGDRKEIRILDINAEGLLPGLVPLGYARGFTFVHDNMGYLYAQDIQDSPEWNSIRLYRFREHSEEEVVFQVPKSKSSRLVLLADTTLLGALSIRNDDSGRMADFWIATRTDYQNWSRVFAGRPLPYRPFLWQNKIFAFVETASRRQRIVELSFDGEEVRVLVPEMDFPVRECAITHDRIYLSRWTGDAFLVEVWDITGKQLGSIDLPAEGMIQLLPGFTQSSRGFFFSHESFDRPPAIYEYDERSDTTHLWHSRKSVEEPSSIEVRRGTFRSKDDVAIPITLVADRKKRSVLPAPVIMTSYGGFGSPTTLQFSILSAIMLEFGAVLAIPHIRGGGDLGKSWHEAGRARRRQNSFDDFLRAAEWCFEEGIADPGRLATFGGSNAGLLVATAATQRPDLFQAVVCMAPLLDMIRYECFDQAMKWRDEYGTVADPDDFRALYNYSPYHHIAEDIDYPAILFVTGDQDDRCNPAHVRKMAAALQERSAQQHSVVVDYSNARGHVPVLPLSTRVEALTRRIAFLCRELNLSLPEGDDDVASRS